MANRGVLLLAPTGKARVQLGDRVGARAQTIAQFLRPIGRWHHQLGYRVDPDADRVSRYATVVIDEASMLTEGMLAAVLDGLSGVERLVLCGDHRQLPPIGAGRPFVDLVAHLRSPISGDDSGGGIAELRVGRRQRSGGGSAQARQRDDLAIAAMFAVDTEAPASDETFARVLRGESDGTIEIVSWDDEDDLHQRLKERLALDPELGLGEKDADALRRSLGASEVYKDRPSFPFGAGGQGAENWQILTPVRARPGGVVGLNRMVHRVWRAGDARAALQVWSLPPPLGNDQVLFYDKVMCVANHSRDGWWVTPREAKREQVANGEIGMATTWYRRGKQKPSGLKVEFSTQPDLQFTFWASELNSDNDRADLLELAYAVTIHKSQGSQFGVTFVVIPNPCLLLSPELLYTALTRQRERTVLFIQGEPSDLRLLADPSLSAVGARLTNLFGPPDPFAVAEGRYFDGSLVHRTAQGDLVRSKSEVIVGDALTRLGISYEYETELRMEDGSWRLPDFTIRRPGAAPLYWEHLGMLDRNGYRADWEAKVGWYAAHGILPWEDGGGPHGSLVWSTEGIESAGIDSSHISDLAERVLGDADAVG